MSSSSSSRPRSKLPTTCGHPDREHHAHGMCRQCYQSVHRGHGDPSFRQQNQNLLFTVKQRCILCGDAFEPKRKCELHPEICDVCHAEYCECTVASKVDLEPLEELIEQVQGKEELLIPLLRARKITLRLAGKTTNSLPRIPAVVTSGDYPYGVRDI